MSKSRRPLTLRRSTIAEARAAGVEDFLALHWEEVETDQDISPLAINWHAYRDLERSGVLHTYLLRRGDTLIGYSTWFVQPLLHHSLTRWAICDLLYVAPEERKGWTGVFLIRQSIAFLKEAGAKIVNVSVKPRKAEGALDYSRGRDTVGSLLSRLDFTLVEEVWVKRL
jgi:hypothetical protein